MHRPVVSRRLRKISDVLPSRRQRAERERVEQNLMRFKLGIERSGEAIFMTAVDGEITYANPAFEKLFGFSGKDWQGKTPRILKSGTLPQEVYEQFWSTILAKQVVTGELVNKTKDGRLLTVQSSANPILSEDGELLGFLAIQRDVTAEKQTEAALRESEMQLEAAQQLASVGSWDWDAPADTITWSKELYRLYGLDSMESPPRFAEQLAAYTPESASRLDAAVQESKATGLPYELDLEQIRPDGTRGWISARGETKSDADGRVVGLHGTVHDITVRKRSEEALGESEETWRTLVNANPESVFLVDTEGRVLVANESAAVRVGRSVQDLVGANAWELLPEEAAATRMRVLEEAVRTGRPVSFQDQLHDRYIEYRVHPVFDGRGKVARLAILGVDLTEHQRAEEALARAGAATQAVLGVVSHVNAELNLADTLQAFCEETLRAFSVDGVSISLYNEAANVFTVAASAGLATDYHEQGGPLPRALYDEYIGRDRPMTVVTDVQAIDGLPDADRYAALDIRSVAVTSMVREGGLIGILGLVCLHEVRDFSPDELGLLEGLAAQAAQAVHGARLRDQLRQSQKMEAIGTLAGGIAHDFNNLLTPMIGYCELLLEGWKIGEARQADVEEILGAAQRAAGLTRQLLAFARRQPLRPRVFDLNEALASMGSLLTRVLGEDILVEERASTGLWRVEADPGQIEQVIMNLAVNARDAMPEGGRLTIETSNVLLGEDFAASHQGVKTGPHVILAITDNGCGMSVETLAQIYDPFFTTKQPTKGTGLGLSTVYGIVKQSGGSILASSEPGKGTTFTIYLPAVQGVAAPLPPKAVKIGTELSGAETILLVEDEQSVRTLTTRVLRRHGYTVVEAAGAVEALALLAGTPQIDLLLTDVVLPGMGGQDLAEAVVQVAPRAKVLFMSGYTRDAIAQSGRARPGITLLEKPFTPDALAHQVREVLDREP